MPSTVSKQQRACAANRSKIAGIPIYEKRGIYCIGGADCTRSSTLWKNMRREKNLASDRQVLLLLPSADGAQKICHSSTRRAKKARLA